MLQFEKEQTTDPALGSLFLRLERTNNNRNGLRKVRYSDDEVIDDGAYCNTYTQGKHGLASCLQNGGWSAYVRHAETDHLEC